MKRSPATHRAVVTIAGLSLLLSGCGALSEEASGTGRSEGEIAAAFYPLAYAAERVAGGHFNVTQLTGPGVEPHDLELDVQKAAAVSGADLVIYETGFQPAIDDAVDTNAEGETLDVAEVVELREVEEHDAEEHADEQGHAEEGEDHGDLDPHFWLDPLLMADLADDLATRLSDLDPDHAADFEANAADLRAELETLDQEYADGLAACERDTVVVSHDAFAYLGRYGLHFDAIAGLSPDSEPTAADLSELRSVIEEEAITTVFSETLAPQALSQTLADDAGVQTAVLDPIEGLSDDTADEDYLSLMRANLAALQQANGC